MAQYNETLPDPEWTTQSSGSLPEFTATNLANYTFYLFRARQLSLQGPSNWSDIAQYHSDSVDAKDPLFPFPLILDSLTCNSISVRWNRPEDRGAEILYYAVTFLAVDTVRFFFFFFFSPLI